jgi:hypothetical protein
MYGDRATGFLILAIVGTVQYAVNGGSFRTATTDTAVNEASIQTLRVKTAALSSCIVQLHGV